MIDFEDCRIDSLCHPLRSHADNLPPRLRDEFNEIGEDQAEKVDELIRTNEYDAAAELIDEMVARLEELEDNVATESDVAHREVYEQVKNTAYYGRIVRASDEHGEDSSVVGALKAARQDLREFPD